MTDLLTRAAIGRAQAALEVASRAVPAPEPFPLSRILSPHLGGPNEPLPAHRIGERGGVLLDAGEFLARDLTTSTSTGTSKAGNLIGSARPGILPELGDAPAVVLAGANVVNFPAAAAVPAWSVPVTASWVSENSAPTDAAPSLALRSLTPSTVAATVVVSRRLRIQSSTDLDRELAAALRRAINRAVDAAVIAGNGTNRPTGIRYASGVNSITLPTSGAFTRTAAAAGLQAIADDGALDASSRLAWIVAPDVAARLLRTEAATGSGFLYEHDDGIRGRLASMPALVTGSCPNGTAVLGDWTKVSIATFGDVEVITDAYSQSSKAAVRLTALLDLAVVIHHVEAFAVASSINVT